MKKLIMSWQLILLLTLHLSCANANNNKPEAESKGCQEHHVVILSMDGFRWDYTQDAYTPTLDSLRKVGTYAQMLPVFPANTFPSHYSMATGLHPNNHGVTNNSFYDQELGRFLSVFKTEDCELEGFWGGEPIWNTVELQGGRANIFMWPGSEYVINGRQASVWTKYDHDLDYYDRADRVVAALSQPATHLPNLVMWYMSEPDGVGHSAGPNSPECIKYVEYIDKVLAYFFQQIKQTPHYEHTNFIFTADHGMTQLSKDRYLNLYKVLDRSKVKFYLSGSPFTFEIEEDYIDEALEKLNATGHLTAYRSEQMPERYHYGTHPTRIFNVVCIPEMGWKLDYRSNDNPPSGGGSHGYDPFHSDMQVVFYGVGPDFKRGYTQKSFQNQNIYLMLCHLAGVEPAKNDGNWDDIKDMFVE